MQASEVKHGFTQKSGEDMTTATGTARNRLEVRKIVRHATGRRSETEVFATRRRSKTEAFSTQWRKKTESLPSVWRKSSHFETSSFHRLAYTEEMGSSEAIWPLSSLFA